MNVVQFTMYNMKFGESILITRKDQIDVLSDFGSKWDEKDMRTTYDKVIRDLSSINEMKVYISHFHLDHYSGLIYTYNNHIHLNIEELILPDINHLSVIRALVTTSFFKAILSKVVLPATMPRTIPLLEFINFLCTNINRTKFLHRGDKIDDHTILWPDKDLICKYCVDFYKDIIKGVETLFEEYKEELLNNNISDTLKIFFEEIENYSTLIHQAFQNERNLNDNDFQSIIPIIDNLGDIITSNRRLREEFLRLFLGNEVQDIINTLYTEGLSDDEIVDKIISKAIRLNSCEHEICLVFHNTDDNSDNYLFTGDIEKKNLEKIIKDFDGKIPLHEYYKYYKVPHHGTNSRKYYTHLIKDKLKPNSYLIISNGKRMKHTTRLKRQWNIDEKYYDIELSSFRHFCSNTDNCKGYSKRSCACKKSIFINRGYKNSI